MRKLLKGDTKTKEKNSNNETQTNKQANRLSNERSELLHKILYDANEKEH